MILFYQTILDVNIIITDSQFTDIGQTLILLVTDICNPANTSVLIKNCTFNDNLEVNVVRFLIAAELSQSNMTLTFMDCKFYNYKGTDLITIIAAYRSWCEAFNQCTFPTNITFRGCLFINNFGSLLHVKSAKTLPCRVNMHIIGPFLIYGSKSHAYNYLIYIRNIVFLINGPLKVLNCTANVIFCMEFCQAFFNGPIAISYNYKCHHAVRFYYCEITFNKEIIFESNRCVHIITLEISPEYAYVSILESSDIKFNNNSYNNLIAIVADKNIPYPPCLFQYRFLGNRSSILPEHFSIIVKDNFYTSCMINFLHYTSHCKWLNTSTFYGQNPKTINQQIIQVNNKKFNQHTTICHCLNCSIDTLGQVYPGQRLQVELCIPCSDYIAIVYAETHNSYTFTKLSL